MGGQPVHAVRQDRRTATGRRPSGHGGRHVRRRHSADRSGGDVRAGRATGVSQLLLPALRAPTALDGLRPPVPEKHRQSDGTRVAGRRPSTLVRRQPSQRQRQQ